MQHDEAQDKATLLEDLGRRITGTRCTAEAVEAALAQVPEFLACRRVELVAERVPGRDGVWVIVADDELTVEPLVDRSVAPRPADAAALRDGVTGREIGWVAGNESEDPATTRERIEAAGAALAMTLHASAPVTPHPKPVDPPPTDRPE